ncbi:phosphoprotein [Trichosanthes associated rhabdovirus 1]|uniref:Phosphoprotein n=1 Tax=Trichosanthes associated rhabdovirus 1 TaxID=2654367 RepID=A0A6F9EY74_9RHAB|nr:phosphoprotein [Trichosanthes associated rhabdovirus 1]DAC81994.1 TPA_asm: phosphoprotein [Trichosanthes associated rhabdovirus 1]
MSDVDQNEFAGAFTPAGETDFMSLACDDDSPVDAVPDNNTEVPVSSSQAVDLPKSRPVGDVGKTLGYLRHSAEVHGAVVDNNMEALFKHYCASESMDARDVELWIRGYVFAAGSQVGPRITELTEALRTEIRSLQRTNATLLDTVKVLANQATSVEKEIAAATVNIKADITAALKSVMKGQTKLFTQEGKATVTKAVEIARPDLSKPMTPAKLPSTMKAGEPSAPETSNMSNRRQFIKMRAVMEVIGIEKDLLDYITDDELPIIYPEEEIRDCLDQLTDPEIKQILYEEITKNIAERLLM